MYTPTNTDLADLEEYYTTETDKNKSYTLTISGRQLNCTREIAKELILSELINIPDYKTLTCGDILTYLKVRGIAPLDILPLVGLTTDQITRIDMGVAYPYEKASWDAFFSKSMVFWTKRQVMTYKHLVLPYHAFVGGRPAEQALLNKNMALTLIKYTPHHKRPLYGLRTPLAAEALIRTNKKQANSKTPRVDLVTFVCKLYNLFKPVIHILNQQFCTTTPNSFKHTSTIISISPFSKRLLEVYFNIELVVRADSVTLAGGMIQVHIVTDTIKATLRAPHNEIKTLGDFDPAYFIQTLNEQSLTLRELARAIDTATRTYSLAYRTICGAIGLGNEADVAVLVRTHNPQYRCALSTLERIKRHSGITTLTV